MPEPSPFSRKNNIKTPDNYHNEENRIPKIVNNLNNRKQKTPNFSSSYIEFSNEIVKYQLMKNKIYLFCLSADGKFLIYNILKCEKIFELSLQEDFNTNFNKMVEALSIYDTVTLKSWFSVDIKLGAITLSFNRNNCFQNSFNFDADYFEKIIDKTQNLRNLTSPKYFSFLINSTDNINQTSSQLNSKNLSLPNLDNKNNNSNLIIKDSLNNNSLSGNIPNLSNSLGNRKETGINSMKLGDFTNLGLSFIKSLFDTFVNDVLLEIKEFLKKNFYDSKRLLNTNFYEDLKIKCSLDSDKKININQDIYLFGCEDEFVKCFAHFREFKNCIKAIDFLREQTPVENVKIYTIF